MSFSNPATQAKDNAARYTSALLALLGDRDPIEVLGRLMPELEKAVAGMSEADLTRPEAPGKWSVIQVVQHLADSELVAGYRIRLVLEQDDPVLLGFDQDVWAERLRYDRVALRDALAQLEALRSANLRLARTLSEAELERAGNHSERGRETIRHILRLEAAHDLLHLRQIERIKNALR